MGLWITSNQRHCGLKLGQLHELLRRWCKWRVYASLMRREVRIGLSGVHYRWLPHTWSLVLRRFLIVGRMHSLHPLHHHRILKHISRVSMGWRRYMMMEYRKRGKERQYNHFTRSPDWLCSHVPGVEEALTRHGLECLTKKMDRYSSSLVHESMHPMKGPYLKIFPRRRSLSQRPDYER